MISNEHIGEAIQRNNDVDTCQFLGKGIFLLRMADWELPQKMNSYAVMKTVDPDWFDIAFSPNVYVTNLMEDEQLETFEAHECSDHAASIVPELDDDWEETESDDGHRELYDDLDIDDTVLE